MYVLFMKQSNFKLKIEKNALSDTFTKTDALDKQFE